MTNHASKFEKPKAFVMPTLKQAYYLDSSSSGIVVGLDIDTKQLRFSISTPRALGYVEDSIQVVREFLDANNIVYSMGKDIYNNPTVNVQNIDDIALIAAAGVKFTGSDVLKESFRTQAALGQLADKGIV